MLADAKLAVELSDTVPADTAPSENFWKINLQKLNFKNTNLTLHMPGDTLQVSAYFGNALAQETYLDLSKDYIRLRSWIGKTDGSLMTIILKSLFLV